MLIDQANNCSDILKISHTKVGCWFRFNSELKSNGTTWIEELFTWSSFKICIYRYGKSKMWRNWLWIIFLSDFFVLSIYTFWKIMLEVKQLRLRIIVVNIYTYINTHTHRHAHTLTLTSTSTSTSTCTRTHPHSHSRSHSYSHPHLHPHPRPHSHPHTLSLYAHYGLIRYILCLCP